MRDVSVRGSIFEAFIAAFGSGVLAYQWMMMIPTGLCTRDACILLEWPKTSDHRSLRIHAAVSLRYHWRPAYSNMRISSLRITYIVCRIFVYLGTLVILALSDRLRNRAMTLPVVIVRWLNRVVCSYQCHELSHIHRRSK